MTWTLPAFLALALALAVLALLHRRAELRAAARELEERMQARRRGSHRARLQHPHIDLSACIGCGTCVRACPEEGVLGMVHGQAVVVHGARCVGHGRCAEACPVGAIAITLGDVRDRRDLPAITEELEAVGAPGLFLAGELTGYALVRTAVAQGTAVADAVARRGRVGDPEVTDLVIVGAGPAGLACGLRAEELGLRYRILEQQPRIGGTVAAYPRRKLVMTQPMELPLAGRLTKLSYTKEELVALWEEIVTGYRLPIRTGTVLRGLRRREDGVWVVHTDRGDELARQVCLALGRRGTPRRLGVPGEDLPKVAHALLDAQAFTGRRVLVVGGGDSAIEAALGLAEQPGNEVTLSYRKPEFFRLKARNERRLQEALAEGRVRAMMRSQVVEITPDAVVLSIAGEGDEARVERIPNDEVFVMIGGTLPLELLERAGVSFDPSARPPPAELAERGGAGLVVALVGACLSAAGLALWVGRHADYYDLPVVMRVASPWHDRLGPKGTVGLACGLAGVALFASNLAYLLRRSRVGGWLPGSLRAWMSAHVLTGLLALLAVVVHAGLAPRDTVGGHAFVALCVVVATGAVGRYFYSFVPRAANGTEADLEDVRTRLAALSGEWDRSGRGFGAEVRDSVERMLAEQRWRGGFFARVLSLVRSQRRLRRMLRALREKGASEGIPRPEVRRMLALTSRAHRLGLMATHYDELRAVLSSWRYFHRWLALLMVLLTAVHVAVAVRYGEIDWSVLPFAGAAGGGS